MNGWILVGNVCKIFSCLKRDSSLTICVYVKGMVLKKIFKYSSLDLELW